MSSTKQGEPEVDPYANIHDVIKKFLDDRGIKYPSCGFFVGPGWLPIVMDTLDKMIAAGWDKELAQVKEKFCGLRIYTEHSESDEVEALIGEAERKCYHICDLCGGPRKYVGAKTGMPMCDDCNKKVRGE